MPIDLRAISTCSLGQIAAEGAQIDTGYIQDQGLIKTTGSVSIVGMITPAIGTLVTFSYTKNGVTRQIPRPLRVLSSYADPFTRITTVELGCKLTYLQDLREEINWKALDDPSTTLTADDAKIVTIPIRAQGIAEKCLLALGLTASNLALSNAFSIAQFDLSPGYVEILSKLLVSESLCGYLNSSEVLQVFSLQQEGGTGPVIDLATVIGSSKIGSGELPGEAVIVSYSSLKLKQPQQEEPKGWQEQSNSVSYSVRIPYLLQSTSEGFIETYNILDVTTIRTKYDDIQTTNGTLRLPVQRVTTFTSGAPAHVGNVYAEYLSYGISSNLISLGPGKPANIPVTKITTETYTYDDSGNEKTYQRTVNGSFAFALGSISVPIVITRANGTIEWVTINFSSQTELEAEVRETKTIGKTQQVTTWSYKPWFMSTAGQQAISMGQEGLTTASAVSNFIGLLLAKGVQLDDYRVETITAPTPVGAPSLADVNNQAAAKRGDPNNGYQTESKAQTILAMGSAAAQRRAEFTLPYAPDDQFIKTGSVYSSIPSDADGKARAYGMVQNRLAFANRNGMNVQLAPEMMPDAPFAPFVLTSGGVSALYRTNGTNWTITPDRVVASTDALYWGAVGGSGPRWFPLAPGITSLPAAPPVVNGQMTVAALVPAFSETTVVEARCSIGASVQVFDYPLVLQEIAPPTTIRTRLLVQDNDPSAITLRTRIALLAQGIEPETVTLRTRVYAISGDDQYAAQRVLLLHLDGADGSTTFTDSSPAARAITAVGSPTITTATSRFGGACLNLPGNSRLQFSQISLTGDYTIQAWVRTATPNADMAIAGALTGNNQFLRWNADGVNGGMLSFALTYIFASTSGVLSGVTANTFVHIAQTREGSVVRDFVNGQLRQTNTSFAGAVIITHIGVGYQGNQNYWVGQMDEVSISTVAEYTANFTPPSNPF